MTHLGQIVLQVGVWVNGPLSFPTLSPSLFMALDTCIRHKGQLELLLELLEREQVSERERDKERREKKKKGVGVFLTSATKKQSNTNGP